MPRRTFLWKRLERHMEFSDSFQNQQTVITKKVLCEILIDSVNENHYLVEQTEKTQIFSKISIIFTFFVGALFSLIFASHDIQQGMVLEILTFHYWTNLFIVFPDALGCIVMGYNRKSAIFEKK